MHRLIASSLIEGGLLVALGTVLGFLFDFIPSHVGKEKVYWRSFELAHNRVYIDAIGSVAHDHDCDFHEATEIQIDAMCDMVNTRIFARSFMNIHIDVEIPGEKTIELSRLDMEFTHHRLHTVNLGPHETRRFEVSVNLAPENVRIYIKAGNKASFSMVYENHRGRKKTVVVPKDIVMNVHKYKG